jgi:hypothetical protein
MKFTYDGVKSLLLNKISHHMNSSGFNPPEPPFDPESTWLRMQAQIQKRISNPVHAVMEDYLKPYMSQEDYNFFSEMCKIQDDYTSWMAENHMNIDPPYVLTDVETLERWRLLSRLRFQAVSDEIKNLPVIENNDAQPEEEPDKLV